MKQIPLSKQKLPEKMPDKVTARTINAIVEDIKGKREKKGGKKK